MVDLETLRASPARARVLLAAAEAALGGREPMEEIPARQLAGVPRPGVNANALLAQRAEALAQLAAAQAALAGLEPPAVSGQAALDAELLRRVAREALDAGVEAESARAGAARLRAELEARGTPEGQAGTSAGSDALRRELSVARRQMAGAVISATGMAILVAAAAWSPLWYSAPLLLVVLFATDLRTASRAAREDGPDQETAAAVEAGEDDGQAAAEAVRRAEEAARSSEETAARALARWGALVPEGPPGEVELVIARRLDRRQRTAPAASTPPDDEKACALRLAEEARAELSRADRTLTDLAGWLGLEPLDPTDIPVAVRRVLDQAEHARLSLAWHEARRAVEATGASCAAVSRRR